MSDGSTAAPIVLVHGAFHGGWCWDTVRPLLVERGHRVSAPSCRGAGERLAEMTPTTSIQDWVEDVCAHIESADLHDVVLVGHSFGGRVISGVAERIRLRLKALLYLDAGLPSNGMSYADEYGPQAWVDRIRGLEVTVHGTRCLRPPAPHAFGIEDADIARAVQGRLTPMPMGVFESRLPDIAQPGAGLPCTYVHCTQPPFARVAATARRAIALGFDHAELAAGHDAMLTHPQAVARLIETAAKRH